MDILQLLKQQWIGFTPISKFIMYGLMELIVHLTVNNTGETKLSNFDLWDIIVVNVENGQASYLSTDQYIITPIEDFVNPRYPGPA